MNKVTSLLENLKQQKLEKDPESFGGKIIYPMIQSIQISLGYIGEDLSDIINQDGDNKTDRKVIDEIVEYLKELKIYKERV